MCCCLERARARACVCFPLVNNLTQYAHDFSVEFTALTHFFCYLDVFDVLNTFQTIVFIGIQLFFFHIKATKVLCARALTTTINLLLLHIYTLYVGKRNEYFFS